MTIPLLSYPPSSQNQRVIGYEVPGDEQPRIFTTEYLPSAAEMDAVISAAYRQLFNEQQLLNSNRLPLLESQLRSGQITVKDFIRGLATSEVFRARIYDVNNNYRFVQMCVRRILGREVYNDREKLSWSIVLATKGLNGFIDELLNTEEYQNNFGDNIVPYQRRRILPQRSEGDLPFARMTRYGEDYRDQLPQQVLYNPFERFNFQKFVTRTNWRAVSGVLALTAVIVIFMLAFSLTVNGLGG
ncbi:MAG: phycobilisome rod-core linker polypeptide [Elainellaceae cyanobacterium]